MENELYQYYKERVIPALRQQHGYKNVHQIPKVEKVVVNTCVGSQTRRQAGARRREGRTRPDHRPAVRRDAFEEEHREFQVAQGSDHRREGHLARRDACTSSSSVSSRWRCPAFAISAAFRRAAFDGNGNYTLGVSDQIDFPRSRARQDQAEHRFGRHHRHHRADERRGEIAPERNGHAFQRPRQEGRSSESVRWQTCRNEAT